MAATNQRLPGSCFASCRSHFPQNRALPTSEGGPGHRPAPAPQTSPSPCREPERNPATAPAAPAETIRRFQRSSAQRSGAPGSAAEGAMGSPILGERSVESSEAPSRTKKGHFSSLLGRGVCRLGSQRVMKPPRATGAWDAAWPSAASRFCRAGGALALRAGSDDPWSLGPRGVGGGLVVPCTASSVPPSSAQPGGVSSAGASSSALSHRLLPRGSILAEATSPVPPRAPRCRVG